MLTQIKKSTLDKFLRRALFEDGYQEDVEAPSVDTASDVGTTGDDTTIPTELPIGSQQEMATQLSIQAPPIDDPDYIPANPTDLSHAADAIAKMVPNNQVEWFYNELHGLLDKSVENDGNPKVAYDDQEEFKEEEEEMKIKDEEGIKKEARGLNLRDLLEVLVEQNEEESSEQSSEMSFDDMAVNLGYSGASGVRQDLERILSRMGYTAETISDDDLASLQSFAVNEFIQHMYKMELIDKEDMDEMLAAPSAVLGLDSFRFFFVSGFMLPAYKKIMRDARKRVEAEIEKLGVPQKSKQTIMNQAFGDTPRNPQKLRNKITKDASTEGVDPLEIKALINQVEAAFPSIQNVATVEGDMVSGAMDVWQGSSAGKRNRVMQQALASTAEFQAGE